MPAPRRSESLAVLKFKIVVHAFNPRHLCGQFACPILLFGVLDDARQMNGSVCGFPRQCVAWHAENY